MVSTHNSKLENSYKTYGMKYLLLFLFFCLWIFLSGEIFAAFSFNISSISTDSISSQEQEIIADISINDLPSESYFRVAWQAASGRPYFGYIKNDKGSWIKVKPDQDCKNYYKVSDTTTTSLSIIAKIGEDNNINNGNYLLKARRYTSNCSDTDSQPISIQINLPMPTSSPTVTLTPTNSPTITKTPTPSKSPTPTKTPTPTKVPTPTKTPTLTPTPKSTSPTPVKSHTIVLSTPTPKRANPTSILGESTESANIIKPTVTATKKLKTKISSIPKETMILGVRQNVLSRILIGIGVIFILACAILGFLSYRRNRELL